MALDFDIDDPKNKDRLAQAWALAMIDFAKGFYTEGNSQQLGMSLDRLEGMIDGVSRFFYANLMNMKHKIPQMTGHQMPEDLCVRFAGLVLFHARLMIKGMGISDRVADDIWKMTENLEAPPHPALMEKV